MYHCRIQFYVVGRRREVLETIVSFQKDREMVTGGDLFMKKGGKIRKTP